MKRLACLLIWFCGVQLGCNQEDTPGPDADPRGAFTLAWTLEKAGGGAVTCTDAMASEVRVNITPVGGGGGLVDSFGCSSGSGQTLLFTPGQYNVELLLRTNTGTTLATENFANQTVNTSEIKDLGSVTFTIP